MRSALRVLLTFFGPQDMAPPIYFFPSPNEFKKPHRNMQVWTKVAWWQFPNKTFLRKQYIRKHSPQVLD